LPRFGLLYQFEFTDAVVGSGYLGKSNSCADRKCDLRRVIREKWGLRETKGDNQEEQPAAAAIAGG